MRINPIARALSAFFLVQVCGPAISPSSMLAAQQPPHCAQTLYCLFNQEAAVSDSAGIHKYSEELIGAIVQNPAGDDSIRQLASHFADRLANAEQAARAGTGKLVPETAVVKAFNGLMQEIGAPASMRASEASVHEFREHAASIKAFPALLSANRNGANCNPGEAVFLLSILISDNGVLYERNLDAQKAMMLSDGRQSASGFSSVTIGPIGSDVSALLFGYSRRHDLSANIGLFNRLVDTLGL